MEDTALLFRLLMFEFILLGTQVQDSYTHSSDTDFLRISPDRLQHFQLDSVSFDCGGFDAPTQPRGIRGSTEFSLDCNERTTTASVCSIARVYPEDSGVYWCETAGGKKSNSVNITVTVGSVILDSPVLPVMEGNSVTLSCRNKMASPDFTADFYKDGLLMKSSSTGQMIIHSVSKSDEGLYKCNISDVGESPQSWLAVRVGSVILDSPVLPVMEGNNVTLSCRNKMSSSNLTADFYKDGRLMKSSSTGEMIIYSVSKSDEGLYKCLISDVGESPQSWLAVRAVDRETCPCSDQSSYVLLLLRTVLTIVMFPLLLVVGLLHCGKLPLTHK